ncbi:hypothetical protein [Oryza sativa Japonica Group]|uniref:Uncharacterized protein n=2 Tax=Oryza sativa subsp. japonica TaxID=39947 RepID=Q5VPP9_ORYSJ|nr:hypothetical protein [Oryza sativa Japonica Group]BAD68941.1 hypothetical protein [Oryza sativa Japonica Group]
MECWYHAIVRGRVLKRGAEASRYNRPLSPKRCPQQGLRRPSIMAAKIIGSSCSKRTSVESNG